MSQTVVVPLELVRRLVSLRDALGDAAFFSFESPEDAPEKVLLADSEVRVLCEWPVATVRETESGAPVELDPTHVAATLAAILNAIGDLEDLTRPPNG